MNADRTSLEGMQLAHGELFSLDDGDVVVQGHTRWTEAFPRTSLFTRLRGWLLASCTVNP